MIYKVVYEMAYELMLCEVSAVFAFSFMQALVSTILAILLALPLAHFFYKFDFFGKNFFISLATVLCIMPTKLAAICVSIFYCSSLATGFTGIILAHLMLNIAFAFYIINLAYYKLDITLFWLAKESGASSWRCYKDITLPVIKPTIVSIFLLLFLLHFASFSIPLILGSSIIHSTPEIAVYNFYSSGDTFSAFIIWALRLLVVLPIFFLHSKHAPESIKASSVPVVLQKEKFSLLGKQPPEGFSKKAFYLAYFIFILIITLGPLTALLVKSCDKKVFDFFVTIFVCKCDPILGACVYRVIINSILLAITSAFGAVMVACLICVLELKLKNKYSKNIISFITILSFVIGSVGVGIVFAYLQGFGLFSQFTTSIVLTGVSFAGQFIIGLLAHVFLNYTFAYRIISAQVILYHPDLTKAAQAMGASYKKALFTVVLPFIFPAVVRAFCMSAGLSLTEVGVGTILNGKIGLTIPIAIKIYRQAGCQEGVIGLSLVLILLVAILAYFFSKNN